MSMVTEMARDYLLGLEPAKFRELIEDMRGELSEGQLEVLVDVVTQEVDARGLLTLNRASGD